MVVIPDLWSHGISGNFATASDWSAGVPGLGYEAEITANGTYTVTDNSTNGVEVFILNTVAHATLAIAIGTFIAYDGTGVDSSTGTIAVGNNSIFEIGGNTAGASPIAFDSPGVIKLNSTGSPTTLVLNGSTSDHTVQLSGGGKLILSANAGNRITGFGTSPTFLNGNVIMGAGTISNVELQNTGTINADDAVPLIIFGGTGSNTGTLEATSTGGLDLVSTEFDNSSGTVKTTAAGASIDLFNGQITNGTVSTVAGSTIVSETGSAGNEIDAGLVTNAGNIVIQANSTLALGASVGLDNYGSIALNASGGRAAKLLVIGTLLLGDGGKITLNNNPQNLIVSFGIGSILDNENNTISGAGTIGDANMTLAQGTTGVIDATGTNPLIIAAAGASFNNFGKLEASGTGGLQLLHVVVDNGGVVKTTAAGTHIDLAGSTIEFGVLQIVAGSTVDTAVIGSNPATSTLSPITLNNAGTLLVNPGTDLNLGSSVNNTGTVVDDGAINLTANVVLNGTGKVELSEGVISGSSNLTNAGNTITGTGLIDGTFSLTNDAQGVIDAAGGAGSSLVVLTLGVLNEGKIEDTGGTDMVFAGPTAVTNDGTIESYGSGGASFFSVINNGALIAEKGVIAIASISGNGALIIGGSGEIEFGSLATGITPNVTFAAGAAGTLAFEAPATTTPNSIFKGTISGFGVGDAIDLGGLSYSGSLTNVSAPVFSAITHDTTVTVANGTDTVTLSFAGNLTSHKFVAGEDGDGGTRLTDPVAKPAAAVTLASTANPPPSLINVTGASNAALLGSYMASTFASAEGHVSTQAAAATQNEAIVAHPHSL